MTERVAGYGMKVLTAQIKTAISQYEEGLVRDDECIGLILSFCSAEMARVIRDLRAYKEHTEVVVHDLHKQVREGKEAAEALVESIQYLQEDMI